MRRMRWAFILFQAVWLNVVLPGHTRGIVTVDGRSHACCAVSHPSKPHAPAPTPSDASRCAICYFAAGCDAPTIITIDLRPTGSSIALHRPPCAPPVRLLLIRAYDATAPPTQPLV